MYRRYQSNSRPANSQSQEPPRQAPPQHSGASRRNAPLKGGGAPQNAALKPGNPRGHPSRRTGPSQGRPSKPTAPESQPPKRSLPKNPLPSLLPPAVYNPRTGKVLGLFSAEDLLLAALLLLVQENQTEDSDPTLVWALLYLLLSDYIDFPF